jgi:hypothetical protein
MMSPCHQDDEDDQSPFALLLDKHCDEMVVLDLTEGSGSGERGSGTTTASRNLTTRHRYFLCPDADVRFSPISFGDGMCSDEIRLYYACLSSQAAGGVISRLQRHSQWPAPASQAERKRPSCLRTSKHKRQGDKGQCGRPTERQRRSSFTCVPTWSDETCLLPRSRSLASLDRAFKKVDFDDYVQVVTIYSHRDYPERTRSKLWMSRAEREACKRRGVAEERMRALDAPAEEVAVPPFPCTPAAKPKRQLERAPSIDSVIDELLGSVTKTAPQS